MTDDLEVLRSNFQEIYHAVNSATGPTLSLVANLSGTCLYDASKGWGRVWRWFYCIVDSLTLHDFHLQKLKQAILHTQRIFHAQLNVIQHNVSEYEAYLKKTGAGYAVCEESLHTARQAIRRWNQSTGPFTKLLYGCKHPKLNKLFQICFGDLYKFTTEGHYAVVASAKAAGEVIDLEGLVYGPLPLEAIKKTLRHKPLNALDQKALDKWINRINVAPTCVHTLHMGLKYLVNCYQGCELEAAGSDVARLEVFLEDRGCTAFVQADPSHIHWRSQLKSGGILTFGQRSWRLGAQLPSLKSGIDHTFVFTVDDPQCVLLVAQNKNVFAMRQFRQRIKPDAYIEPAYVKEIFEDGRWAIMERLQSFEKHAWSTADGTAPALHPADKPLVQILSNLLGRWVKQQLTPRQLCAADIMFDRRNCLKALKPFIMHTFDFNALEDFALTCAAGNNTIFKQIMLLSGLGLHPIGEFYRELVKNALDGDQTAVDDMAGIYKIVDPKVVDRGRVLVNEATALRDKLYMHLRHLYPDQDPKAIQRIANAKLLSAYQASKVCSRLYNLRLF